MESFFPEGDLSTTILVCTVLLVALGIAYPRWRRHADIQAFKKRHGCLDPPYYPHSDPLLGSDLVRIRTDAMNEGRLYKLYQSQFELYGKTFKENLRGREIINTIEPVNIQQVTSLAFNDWGKDPSRIKAHTPFLGPSIFSEGLIWKQARALVMPIFARAEISDIDQLALFADRFMELIPGDGSMIDMQPLLHRLVSDKSMDAVKLIWMTKFFDVSMDFLFGKSMNSLQPETSAECTEFLEAFSTAQKWVSKRREAGWQLFLYSFDKEWKDSYTKVHRFVDEQVARALREIKNGKPESGTGKRKRYVLLDEMAKQIKDPIQLRYQIIGVFMPARDTTSIAVGNVIFQLARHPHVWTKLRRTSLELGDAPLTFEKLRSLVDFRHVVHETIRLCGPSARVWRVALRDTVLPSGGGPDRKSPVFVAQGTPIVLGAWCVHHDRDIWGDDIDQFRPERWIDRKSGWEFVPFLGGPRTCPAQQQVLTHAVYILIRLTQRFESIENCDPVFEYIEKFTMGFQSRNGVRVAFKQA